MENRFIKYIFSIALLLNFYASFGQGNPGFLGKKIAIGYSKQYSFFNGFYIFDAPKNSSLMGVLTNNDFYLEYATSKYKSISAHLSYQKVPLNSTGLLDAEKQMTSSYVYSGVKEITYIKSGYSDFQYLSTGIKMNFYTPNKTIASPVGFCYYVRMDMNFIKAMSNTYDYETTYFSLSEAEKTAAQKQINRTTDGASSMNLSLGIGGEAKLLLSSSVFLRINSECNLSTVGITQLAQQDVKTHVYDIKEDLRVTGQGLNRFRNLFLFGMGVGILL